MHLLARTLGESNFLAELQSLNEVALNPTLVYDFCDLFGCALGAAEQHHKVAEEGRESKYDNLSELKHLEVGLFVSKTLLILHF